MLVRNLGYTFKLMHAPEGWKHAMGQGANFLMNQEGRVLFRPHFNGPGDLRTADRLVAGLLRHEPRPNLRRHDLVGKAGITGA